MTKILNPPAGLKTYSGEPVPILAGYVCNQCKAAPVPHNGLELCDDCKTRNIETAKNTSVQPTCGDFIAELDTGGIGGRCTYRVKTKGWLSDTLAVVCPQGKSSEQLVSDTVLLIIARTLWDNAVFDAERGDVTAGQVVADAEALYQKLMSEDDE